MTSIARLAAVTGSMLAGLAAVGCLDLNPGAASSQPESRVYAASVGHPGCIEPALLLVLDRDAISPGRAPFSESELGCARKRVGYRATVDWFARHIGEEVVLPGGRVGNEGWFAFTSVRFGWQAAGPDKDDGMRNYLAAGPGLGSADAKGNPETLLEKVPGLAPLRATGLARLEGRSVCAVVLDGDVRMSYAPVSGNIRGPNLGKVAFQILSVADGNARSGSQLPDVRVRVLDADAVCSDPLAKFPDAPALASESNPPDAERPACAVFRTLLDEQWNRLDTTLWRTDGDGVASGGLFQTRDGAGSAAADWVPDCPVLLDSAAGIRFENRVQLQGSAANDFVESGALFLINGDADGTFSNYAFVNVGFTGQPGKVFAEIFGSSGGQDFDQFEESSLPSASFIGFPLDIWIFKDSYQIAINGEVLDTLRFASPLSAVSLFEVGVQQNDGLRGLVNWTKVTAQCQREKERDFKCRRHSEHRFCARNGKLYGSPDDRQGWQSRDGKSLARGCLRNRNRLIRMAKEKTAHCAHPSKGLLLLARMREAPDTYDR
jgi:hypothetical protein